MIEEFGRSGCSGPGFNLSSDIVGGYLAGYGAEAQKRHWLPRMAAGDAIAAVAMTEPGGGSDLQAIRTSAIRDGDYSIINGPKTSISNGQSPDEVAVEIGRAPRRESAGRDG